MLFVVSTIGCAVAPSVWQLAVWRLVGGMGVGLAMISCPIYIAELSPPHLRGTLVNVNQLVGVIGINLAVLVGYFVAEYGGGWRLMFATQGVPGRVPDRGTADGSREPPVAGGEGLRRTARSRC